MSGASRIACAVAVLMCLGGCESEIEAPAGRVLVFAAFPAELQPLLERATIEETVQIEGRWFRIGTLGGTPVVIGMTGIGIANAAQGAQVAFDHFDVIGAVFSGVAGSYLRIGDVVVPDTWELASGESFPSHLAWLDLAQYVTTPGVAELDTCTEIPSDPELGLVCLTVPPVIVVGGKGVSGGFEDFLVPCQPDGGDVFGCDQPDVEGEGQTGGDDIFHPRASVAQEALASQDMETAAVAREAAARGLRFIAFRAVSDGAGDPLNLPGFPAQFFAYYRLAGRNAAGATTAFLERLAAEHR
jgi:nucleoside phosphorylase